MDLIYMDKDMVEQGVILDYTFDLAFGSDENNFECEIEANAHCCEAGYFLSIEGTEYGGIIDSISVDTQTKTVKYIGRTWHGILNSKVIEPDSGEDYYTISGEANAVIGFIIEDLGLSDLFTASEDDSEIIITPYKMNRYISAYDGIVKMLKSVGAKLNVSFEDGSVILSALDVVDYTQDDQFDTDQISFKVQKNDKPVNHVICLGQGELKDREVIHVYADEDGEISTTKVFTGIDEVTQVYDYPSAESTDELKKGGIEMIENAWNSDTVEFDFSADESSFDIGDIVGAVERITGIEVASDITKKIVRIQDGQQSISYKVGD